MSTKNKRKKVAILGGGPGGLSAAFHLATSGEDLDITIYQMGWRLGGKGASGRNYSHADRIEEHGIHLFGNFYPNALHMIQSCYENEADFEREFQPMNLQLMTEFYAGKWHRFPLRFAASGKQPWQTDEIIAPLDQVIEKSIENLHEIFNTRELKYQSAPPQPSHWFARLITPLVRKGLEGTLPHGDAHLEGEHQSGDYRHGHTWKTSFQTRMLRAFMTGMRWIARHHARVRYIYTQLDHLLGCVHGYLAFDLKNKGIGSINHWSHLKWLHYCGVSEMTLNSPAVKAIPNVCFQFPFGDTSNKPDMAASAYMTYILRQMLASGDNLFFFRSGTGETAIRPIYDALCKHGVKVEFFHKVRDVVPSATEPSIARIDIEVQARPKGEYEPLDEIEVKGEKHRVWPATMPYDKLENGDRLKKKGVDLESWWAPESKERISLEKGKDFDYVVMAIPIGAHPFACPSLLDTQDPNDPNHALKLSWASMHEHVHTIPTQSVQLWLKDSIDSLGLPKKLLRYGERYAGPTYNDPMSGWTDFSDLLELENWGDDGPKGLIYFCGALQEMSTDIPLDDPTFPACQYERVKATVVQQLRHLNGLLEKGTRDDQTQQLRFELLDSAIEEHDLNFRGEQRVACQHIKVNIDPNERYTLSEPGHEKHLKHAWESGYDNLALAGDWIFTGFNIGSFEGSVMSGKLASYALTGSPDQDHIYGFNFLRERKEPDNVPMIR